MSDQKGLSGSPASARDAPAAEDQFDRDLQNACRLVETDAREALIHADDLLQLRRDPRVFRVAAQACRKLGRGADAVAAELAGIQAGFADRDLERAAIADSEGKPAEALAIAEEFLREQPADLLARMIAAQARVNLWDLETAEAELRSILERVPTFLRASMLLSRCLTRQARPRDALRLLEEVVARKPNNTAALTELAQLRAEVGDVAEAISVHEKLVSLEPGRTEPRVNLAGSYTIAGRRDAAIEALRQALRMDSRQGGPWWSLANYFPDEIDERDELTIRAALPGQAGTPNEGALHLALGLIADRSGSYVNAFEHFMTGKKVLAARQPYDPALVSAAVDRVIGTFTPEFYEGPGRVGCTDAAPIFIVGMPRSGTTLVERMLGRHSAIEASGELPIFARLAERASHRSDNPENHAALLEALADPELSAVGELYMRASRDYRRSAKPRFIDKNNLNWMRIGLILLALPTAKIIDLRRNALDCCWANFKMLFSEGFPAANDLGHIGQFYRDYVRLFEAVDRAAPGRILQVRYEGVVDDAEAAMRRILDFLDLPFEADCLDFHLSTDAVATASSEQVRRPLNRKGIGSAEPYRQWLGPLLEELGPLADA